MTLPGADAFLAFPRFQRSASLRRRWNREFLALGRPSTWAQMDSSSGHAFLLSPLRQAVVRPEACSEHFLDDPPAKSPLSFARNVVCTRAL